MSHNKHHCLLCLVRTMPRPQRTSMRRPTQPSSVSGCFVVGCVLLVVSSESLRFSELPLLLQYLVFGSSVAWVATHARKKSPIKLLFLYVLRVARGAMGRKGPHCYGSQPTTIRSATEVTIENAAAIVDLLRWGDRKRKIWYSSWATTFVNNGLVNKKRLERLPQKMMIRKPAIFNQKYKPVGLVPFAGI